MYYQKYNKKETIINVNNYCYNDQVSLKEFIQENQTRSQKENLAINYRNQINKTRF